MKVAWTGHRPEYFRDPAPVEREVERIAASLSAEFGRHLVFVTGGQRGVDTWAALAAQRLGLPLHLYLPLPAHLFTADWTNPQDVVVLMQTWDYASQKTVIDEAGSLPHSAAYDRRNQALVDNADRLVAVWTGVEMGGTYYTVNYARARGKPISEFRFPRSETPIEPGKRGL